MLQKNFLIPCLTMTSPPCCGGICNIPVTCSPGTLTTTAQQPQTPQIPPFAPDPLTLGPVKIQPVALPRPCNRVQDFDFSPSPRHILSTNPKRGPASIP